MAAEFPERFPLALLHKVAGLSPLQVETSLGWSPSQWPGVQPPLFPMSILTGPEDQKLSQNEAQRSCYLGSFFQTAPAAFL